MIKQRNTNITHKNNPHFNNNKHQQSPFNRQNPYRVKVQFYSQHKKGSTLTSTTDRDSNNNKDRKASRQSNPQSLLYRRDYKQNPPTMYISEYKKLKDNFIQVKNNILMRNLSRGNGMDEELEEQQYRLRLKNYMADRFCPSDPYLQIVKDKFVYFSNTTNKNSQFQNMMKMSNLGISNLVTKNNNNHNSSSRYTSRSGVSYKDRMNPFYRKSLISLFGNDYNHEQEMYYESQYRGGLYDNSNLNNKWQYFAQIADSNNSRISSSYNNNNSYNNYYPYNTVHIGTSSFSNYHYDQTNTNNIYQTSIPSPLDPSRYYHPHNHIKPSSYYSQHQNYQLSQSQSRVTNYNNNNHNNGLDNSSHNNHREHQYQSSQTNTFKDNISPKSSLAASFGPQYQWKANNMMKPYIDAVIENHLQDPLNIQANAPKQIKIKGKTFYVNRVNRFK